MIEWKMRYCKCGERFMGNNKRCVKCREFYWRQKYEGIPAEERHERWEYVKTRKIVGELE